MGRPTFAKATAGEWKVGAAKFFYGPIAQSVEQLAFNQWVGGSNPPRLSFSPMQTLPKAKICMTAKGWRPWTPIFSYANFAKAKIRITAKG
jgi:hypothetical protein